MPESGLLFIEACYLLRVLLRTAKALLQLIRDTVGMVLLYWVLAKELSWEPRAQEYGGLHTLDRSGHPGPKPETLMCGGLRQKSGLSRGVLLSSTHIGVLHDGGSSGLL